MKELVDKFEERFVIGETYSYRDVMDVLNDMRSSDIRVPQDNPGAYTYNRINKGMSKFIPLFEMKGSNEYLFLGEGYSYNGELRNYNKQKDYEVLGIWTDGVLTWVKEDFPDFDAWKRIQVLRRAQKQVKLKKTTVLTKKQLTDNLGTADRVQVALKAFDLLLAAKSIEEVDSVIDNLGIPLKYMMDSSVYPEINFKITNKDIQDLKEAGVIGHDNLIQNINEQNIMTKLLYALSWKNGDLKKIHHIIDGISDMNLEEKKKGFVFFQFGKYLTKTLGEPIIDQHVLRAFNVFLTGGDEAVITKQKLLKKDTINAKDVDLIEEYKEWLGSSLTDDLRSIANYTYHVDKVLFAVGKFIKEKR